MRIILLYKHLNRIRHPTLSKQLQLLRSQILLHKRPHAHLRKFLAHAQLWVVDAQLWLVDGYLGGTRRGFFGSVEDEQVSGVSNAALEFLPESDGIGGFGYACCVDLEDGFRYVKEGCRDDYRPLGG